MTYVMEMSTDQDIVDTPLDAAWNPINARYDWNQVSAINLGIPNNAIIVVVAHGDGNEIGNAEPGTIDINAQIFLALIQGNMANNAMPASIYISTCGPGIAQFAAAVRLAAEQNDIWVHTRIYGHSDPVAGPVPPPNDVAWVEIF
ncbi:MAG: hypothetical protein HY850_12575 [Betaproteobacteria bacterium]|nr:hypothetical protein [Betaproteobacteria bacterium]